MSAPWRLINKMETQQKQTAVPFPVDRPLEQVDLLFASAGEHSFLNNDVTKETFILSYGLEVVICQDNIACLTIFRDDQSPSVLILHLPNDKTQVVAVYLYREWWSVEEVMKTSSKTRCGLIEVSSIMEKVVMSLMSQIIFGVLERALEEEFYFSPPDSEEFGKILWQDGEAAGFYTIKKKGTLCSKGHGQSYLLPVLDTVFVRTPWRRRGMAMQMLADFCSLFPQEEALGISHPISASMYEVCRKFLEGRRGERERLYVVESPGDWGQRRNVWLTLRLGRLTGTRKVQSPLAKHTDKIHRDEHKEGKVLPVSADGVIPAQGTLEKNDLLALTTGNHINMGESVNCLRDVPGNAPVVARRRHAKDHMEENGTNKKRRSL